MLVKEICVNRGCMFIKLRVGLSKENIQQHATEHVHQKIFIYKTIENQDSINKEKNIQKSTCIIICIKFFTTEGSAQMAAEDFPRGV